MFWCTFGYSIRSHPAKWGPNCQAEVYLLLPLLEELIVFRVQTVVHHHHCVLLVKPWPMNLVDLADWKSWFLSQPIMILLDPMLYPPLLLQLSQDIVSSWGFSLQSVQRMVLWPSNWLFSLCGIIRNPWGPTDPCPSINNTIFGSLNKIG